MSRPAHTAAPDTEMLSMDERMAQCCRWLEAEDPVPSLDELAQRLRLSPGSCIAASREPQDSRPRLMPRRIGASMCVRPCSCSKAARSPMPPI